MSSFHVLEEQLCVALGLDPSRVNGLTIDLRAGELPIVTARMYVTNGDKLAVPIQMIEREYELKLIAETKPDAVEPERDNPTLVDVSPLGAEWRQYGPAVPA